MAYQSVAEIFETIDGTRERLYRRVEGLSPAQEKFRPTPDAWSVAEIVEHLGIMENRLSSLMKMMLKKAESASVEAASDLPDFRPFSLDQHIERSLKEKYIAPETVHPTGNVSLKDSLDGLRRSRSALHDLRPRFETTDVSNMTYPHPVFGPLDLHQWLAFIGVHEERHLRQIETVISSPEFV